MGQTTTKIQPIDTSEQSLEAQYIRQLNDSVSAYCSYCQEIFLHKHPIDSSLEQSLVQNYKQTLNNSTVYKSNADRAILPLYIFHLEHAKKVFENYYHRYTKYKFKILK